MIVLINILLVIAIIIALLFIAALFVKKDYTIKGEVVVNRPIQDVFNYIKFLKNQDNYSKWVMVDPNMKKSFSGTDGTPGFVYAWEGNKKAGKGEQEITGITENARVDVEIRFIKPFEGTAYSFLETMPVAAGQSAVKWQMSGKAKYPLNITNVFITGMLRKDLDTSLHMLKNILENK